MSSWLISTPLCGDVLSSSSIFVSPSFCETSLSIPSLVSSAVSGFVDDSVDLICSSTSDFIVLSSASDSLLHFYMSLLTLASLLASMFDLVSGYIPLQIRYACSVLFSSGGSSIAW